MKKKKIPIRQILAIIASTVLVASVLIPAIYTVVDVLKNR